MSIKIHIVKAFTDAAHRHIGGNPAGVVLDADNLLPSQKQLIAARLALSETAFVSASNIAPFKLEFFTPTRQIAHCGHATIATFSLLRDVGYATVGQSAKETIDGTRNIIIGKDRILMEQSRPEFIEISPHRQLYQDILDALNISADMMEGGQNPFIINTGNKFMIVPIKNAQSLKALRPDYAKIAKISETFGLIGFYPFTFDASGMDRIASARMFAPLYGIAEEPATGMAAGCLAAYLYCIRDKEGNNVQIEQGYLMPDMSPSLLHSHIKTDDRDRIKSLLVGGDAKLERTLELTL